MEQKELIDKIKTEIEKQEKQCPLDTYEGRHKLFVLGGLKTILSTLESEKPMSFDSELDEEMDRFFEEMPVLEHENIFEETYQMIARHFYELGKNSK